MRLRILTIDVGLVELGLDQCWSDRSPHSGRGWRGRITPASRGGGKEHLEGSRGRHTAQSCTSSISSTSSKIDLRQRVHSIHRVHQGFRELQSRPHSNLIQLEHAKPIVAEEIQEGGKSEEPSQWGTCRLMSIVSGSILGSLCRRVRGGTQ